MIESFGKISWRLLRLILVCFAALFLILINLFLIFPWFSGNGPASLGSIEVSYVSMAKFIVENWPHLTWAPFWYFGFPFHLFYTPLLPFLEVLFHLFGGFSFWQSYRLVSGIGYVFVPASVFFFVWGLTRKITPALLAGLLYSFLPSIFYFILPSGEVARDIINVDPKFFDPRRLVILARWGEGPHTLSLAFLPLGGLFFLKSLENPKLINITLAAIFIGLVALTNAVGFYALAILLLAIFSSQLVQKGKNPVRVFKVSIATGVITYGLIAFWYNLSFLGTFLGEGGGVLKNYISIFPWGFLLILFFIIGIFFFFRRVVKSREITIVTLWFLILFLVVYIYYTSAPPEFSEERLELAPQALRLMTASDMAFSVFLAAIVGALISFLGKKHKVGLIAGNLIGIALIAGVLVYGYSYFPYAQKAVSGEADLTKTGEYEIANWLKENVEQKKGERIYVAGNYGFYLNYFTNIWQLRGGLYQAMTHYWSEHIYYQVNHGEDKKIALAWLKASNIKYIVVNTLASRELYKEFETPGKFEEMKIVYHEKGDIVYEVPLKTTGPAKVVSLDLMGLVPPKKTDDKEALFAYVDWLEKSSPASFEAANNNLYKIKATVAEGEGILVQMTYDEGFKAKSNQGKVGIKKDSLGFMVLVPSKAGEYEIVLKHGKTWKIWLGYLTTLGTIGFLAYLFTTKKKELIS